MQKLIYLNERTQSSVGNKALRLQELSCAQFPVPPGFVLADPKVEASELTKAISAIGGFPVAVRSSGTIEDLADASFAGMYETFLNVNTYQELTQAIHQCFESSKAPRVKEYLASKGHSVSEAALEESMRVLVQKMVPADRAGVLFTIDPVSGREEHFYLEICQGLGERLVSGHVTPSRYVYDWQKGALVKEELSDEKVTLSASELKALAQLASSIQSFYQHPQDIEFAFDPQGKLWILQSRPVTHVAWRRDVPELTNADFKDGGVSARLCMPMMYSVYQRAIQASMGRYFEDINLVKAGDSYQWIFYHYGRAYWNAGAVKECLRNIPGFDEQSFDRDLGIFKDYGPAGPLKVKLTIKTLLSALNALCGLKAEYENCRRMIDSFTVWFDEKDKDLKAQLRRLEEMSESEFWTFVEAVSDFQFKTECNYFRTIYNNSNMQSDLKSALRKVDRDSQIDYLKLISGLPQMAHMQIEVGLAELHRVATVRGFQSKEWKDALDDFLRLHYHHGDAELDLTEPRWGEVPERIEDLVRTYAPKRVEPSESQYEWEEELAKLDRLKGQGATWRLFGRRTTRNLVHSARDYLVRREHMRTLSTRAYFLLRMVLLEGEKRLNLSKGDVHVYRIEEFLGKVALAASEFENRKNYLSAYRKFTPPNEFGGGMMIQASDAADRDQLQGIGCSSGEVEAVVRVINKIEEAHLLQAGEVLVTKFTDPGWTPIMSRAAAVITEVGGVLSHAAVIGREYRIPAVLNVSSACSRLQTGDLVRVNGRTGTITKLEKVS